MFKNKTNSLTVFDSPEIIDKYFLSFNSQYVHAYFVVFSLEDSINYITDIRIYFIYFSTEYYIIFST